jgi:hypothetical protein
MLGSVAMTLKPTNHHIPGWKKSFNFLHRYKQIQIHYGADGTGDVYNLENQAVLAYAAGTKKVHLFISYSKLTENSGTNIQTIQKFVNYTRVLVREHYKFNLPVKSA